eukprot:6203752-Amphidinium_carterae.1
MQRLSGIADATAIALNEWLEMHGQEAGPDENEVKPRYAWALLVHSWHSWARYWKDIWAVLCACASILRRTAG